MPETVNGNSPVSPDLRRLNCGLTTRRRSPYTGANWLTLFSARKRRRLYVVAHHIWHMSGRGC